VVRGTYGLPSCGRGDAPNESHRMDAQSSANGDRELFGETSRNRLEERRALLRHQTGGLRPLQQQRRVAVERLHRYGRPTVFPHLQSVDTEQDARSSMRVRSSMDPRATGRSRETYSAMVRASPRPFRYDVSAADGCSRRGAEGQFGSIQKKLN